MSKEELRRYIERVLLDIKGDNESPEDVVLKANASLITYRFSQYEKERDDELVKELKNMSKITLEIPDNLTTALLNSKKEGFNTGIDKAISLIRKEKE